MSDIFICEIEKLEKQGVKVIKIEKEYRKNGEKHTTIELTSELDFSEHDKVFKDKIANLENQIAYMKEKKNYLRTRCMEDAIDAFDRGSYGALTIVGRRVDLEAENEKLKQRIAELESKETENVNEMPDSITIDGYKCKIIKTESGLYISRDEIYSIIDKEKEPLKQKCKELEDKHQSDCIEINRLNTTIDVLIHKVEYLRQFAGLE